MTREKRKQACQWRPGLRSSRGTAVRTDGVHGQSNEQKDGPEKSCDGVLVSHNGTARVGVLALRVAQVHAGGACVRVRAWARPPLLSLLATLVRLCLGVVQNVRKQALVAFGL